MLVRDATPADAEPVAAVRRSVLPHLPTTAAGMRHRIAAGTAAVAVDGDAVVGFALLGRPLQTGGRSERRLTVAVARRGHGAGRALYGWVEDRSGHDDLVVVAEDDPGSLGFAEHRGFLLRGRSQHSLCDPGTLTPPEPRPGVTWVAHLRRS